MSEHVGVRERLSALFSAKLNLQVPSTDTDLLESGILDSMTFVDLLVCLEKEFNQKISLDRLEIDNFRSIDRIVSLLDNHS